MPLNETNQEAQAPSGRGRPVTEKRMSGEVKVHVTPKGGRYVDPDDLVESPFLNEILGLENVEPKRSGGT